MKKFNKKEKIGISLFLILLSLVFISKFSLSEEIQPSQAAQELQFSGTDTSYYYPSLNDPSNFLTWRNEFCSNNTGMDFLIEMPPDACSPSPVTSDLLEEQPVQVLCKLTGIKINPLINVPNIKKVIPIIENQSKEISYISFYPARSALGYYNFNDQFQVSQGSPTLNNLGYLLLTLKQQPVERNMSRNVSAQITVNITYDVAKTYGISTEQFVLPVLSQQDWQDQYKKYSFWHGRGYLRLQSIEGQNAKIAVYSNPIGSPIAFSPNGLREGQSLSVSLPGLYCEGPVNVTLDEIRIPTNAARFMINGNTFILSEGDDFADSGCSVSNVQPGRYLGGEVHVSCQGHVGPGQFGDYIFKSDPLNAKINLIDFSNPSGSERTIEVGDELEIATSSNEKQYYYVAFIGKTADISSGKTNSYSYTDTVIIFGTEKRLKLDVDKKQKFVQAIQDAINGKSVESLTENEIMANANKNSQVSSQIKYLKMFKKTMGLVPLTMNSKLQVISAKGPVQVTYSNEIEQDYKEAINYYKSISAEFPRLANPDGYFYGIAALRQASELAGYLSKENDQIELLQSIIDKYQEIDDPYIQGEVEAARSDILLLSQGSGESRSKIIETSSGTYYATLLSINKPGLNSQEARLRINNSETGIYIIGDQIANIIITGITDTGISITYDNGIPDSIAKGTSRTYNATRIEVVSTSIRREAKVTVWPFESERTTTTNFSVVIGITKRSIQLTPAQISKKIIELNKTIETLNKYVDFLEKTTSTLKKACYVGGTVLWAKNFLSGLTGESFARRWVMKAWSQKCASESYRIELGSGKTVSLSGCYNKKGDDIENDVNLVTTSVNKANDFIKKVKSNPGVVSSGGILGLSKKINEEKFISFSKDLFLQEQSSLIENVKVNVLLGSLTRPQKSVLLSNQKIIDDKTPYCPIEATSTSPAIPAKTIKELLELDDQSLTKELKACEIPIPVDVKTVIENLNLLYTDSEISSDDIKDIFLILSINQQSSSVSDTLKSYNNFQIFSKFDSYLKVVGEKSFQSNMKRNFGVDVPYWKSEKTESLVVSQIFTLGLGTYSWFNDTDNDSEGKSTQDIAKDYGGQKGGKQFILFATSTAKVFAILEPVGESDKNRYLFRPAFNITDDNKISIVMDKDKVRQKISQDTKENQDFPDSLILQDIEKCKHEVNPQDYQIKFWESGPYEGLVAQMIISRNEGWYYTTKAYSGVEGKMVSYKETGQANEYWICNVGDNGKPEFNFYSGPSGDDDCCFQISKTTNMEIPDKIKEWADKVEKKCLPAAQTSYSKKERPIKTADCGNTQPLGKPPTLIPSSQCEDFMSPDDCKILFNLCDPVICPPSRCDMGGRFPVENVIQSGIIGSLVLCLGNSDEVAIPICISGLYNGLDALNNMVFKQYKECLQKQLDTGQTTGVCDYWHSVYLCQLLWGNLDPFIKAGLPLIAQSFSQGGGEYSLFSEALKNADDSMGYFTQVYGVNAFTSFKERATNQSGAMICDKFVSVVYPTAAKFVDDLTKADSYYSIYASIDEVSLGANPESQYRVFYDIYAGKDQSASYQVYIKKPSSSSQGYEYEINQLPVRNAQGFLSPGETRAEKVDFTAPPGYNEVCVNINGKENCFLGAGGTSFAISELQNLYLEDEIKKDIKTEQTCKAGSPTLVPTASLNLQSQIQEHLQPEIYRRGIIRICASENPGTGTEDSERYQRVGYCDNTKIGCWLDMNSVDNSISDLGIRENIEEYAKDLSWMYLLNQSLADQVDVTETNIIQLKTELSNARKELYGPSMKMESGKGIYRDYLNKIKAQIYASARLPDSTALDKLKDEIRSSSVIISLSEISRKASTVSERALKPVDKAEAAWIQAQAMDERLRFLSLTEMVNAQIAIAETCEAFHGVWMDRVQGPEIENNCPEGVEQPWTKDMALYPGKVCCVKEGAIETPITGVFSQDQINQFSQGTVVLSEMANGYRDLMTAQKLEQFLKENPQPNSPFSKEVIDTELLEYLKTIPGADLNLDLTNRKAFAIAFYNLGIKYDIDPAFGLAVAIQESGWATDAKAQQNKNLFGISVNGVLKNYPSYEAGIEDFYKKIRDEYVSKNPVQKTPASIICFVNGAYQPNSFPNHCYCEKEKDRPASEGCVSWFSDVPSLRKRIQNLAASTSDICIQEANKLMLAADFLKDQKSSGQWSVQSKDSNPSTVGNGYVCCGTYLWNVFRVAESKFDLNWQNTWYFWQDRSGMGNKLSTINKIDYVNINNNLMKPGDVLYFGSPCDHIMAVGTPIPGENGKFYVIGYNEQPSQDPRTTTLKFPDYLYTNGKGSNSNGKIVTISTLWKDCLTEIYRPIPSCYSSQGQITSSSSNAGLPTVAPIVTIKFGSGIFGFSWKVRFNKQPNKKIWDCQASAIFGNYDACSTINGLGYQTSYKTIAAQLALKDELQGYQYLKLIDGTTIDGKLIKVENLPNLQTTTPTTPTTPTSPTTPTTPSASTISQVLLVSKVGTGIGEYTSENKVVNFNDGVEICAVIKKGDDYYSGKSFNAKINSIEKSVSSISDSITIRWYNVQPLWKHPDALSSFFPIVTGSNPYPYYQNNNQASQLLKNSYDVLQYTPQYLGGGWCVTVPQTAGTKWFRVEIDYNSQTYYSPGKPSSSADISNYPSAYAGQQTNLVESSSYDIRGISPSVYRISRKSDYDKSQATSSEKELIRAVEAYKNVPYILSTDIPRYQASMTDYITNFKATECASLLIGGAKLTSQGTFIDITDTGSVMVNKARNKNKIIQDTNNNVVEKIPLRDILAGNPLIKIDENKQNALHIGDMMLLWNEQESYYYHASMLYEDKGIIGILDSQDTFIYISTACHSNNNGQLCYNTPSYFSSLNSNAEVSLIRITN